MTAHFPKHCASSAERLRVLRSEPGETTLKPVRSFFAIPGDLEQVSLERASPTLWCGSALRVPSSG